MVDQTGHVQLRCKHGALIPSGQWTVERAPASTPSPTFALNEIAPSHQQHIKKLHYSAIQTFLAKELQASL